MEKVMSTKMVRQIGSPKSEVYKKLDLSLSVQRGFVWSDDQKSLLIHSLIDGFVVPPILLDDRQDGFYRLIDGKQRTNCIQSFYSDSFKISANTPPLADGREINGLKYSKLPEDLKEKLDTAEMVMWHIRGLTDELRDEMFARVNAGTVLIRSELTRAMAGHEVSDYLNSLSVRDFFAKRVILSTVGRKRKLDHDLILQCLSLVTMRASSFAGKDLQKFAMEMKATPLAETVKAEFSELLDYLEQAYPEVEGEPDFTYDELKKVNVPIIMKIAQVMIENGMEPVELYDFTQNFFSGKNKNGQNYKAHSASATATKKSIRKRFEIMLKDLMETYPTVTIPDSANFSQWDIAEAQAKADAEALKVLKAEQKAERLRATMLKKAEKKAALEAKALADASKPSKAPEYLQADAETFPTQEESEAIEDEVYEFSTDTDEDLEDEDEPFSLFDAVRRATLPAKKLEDDELDRVMKEIGLSF